MPTPIIFTITAAGRLAALDAFDNGFTIALTDCAFGSGKYAPTGSETALNTELGRVSLLGGTIESASATLRFSASLTASTHISVFEIGLFSSTGVLFAVASTTSTTIPLVVIDPNIETICAFGLVFDDIPASSLTITLDPNAPLAIQLINTLRLRLTANGIDADLAVTNNATGLDFNNNQFKVAGTWYFDHALNTSTENTAGIITVKKVGNKAFQHEILENGQAANRVFTGIQWLPWVYQTGAVQGVVTFIPIDDYVDLNDFNTEGYFTFSTSDNVGHAPPTYGLESDYELQVLLLSGTLIQIVKNITTNASSIRSKDGGSWPSTWTLSAPIQSIVTNANINSIRSEGVYLCAGAMLTDEPDFVGPPIFILYVKNSETLQTVVQLAVNLNKYNTFNSYNFEYFKTRAIIDSGASGNNFGAWANNSGSDPDQGIVNYFLSPDKTTRLYNYLSGLSVFNMSTLENFNFYLRVEEGCDNSTSSYLRNYNLDNVTQVGLYPFTLDDNISNIPSVFTDTNHFFFLLAFDGTSSVSATDTHLAQIIFQAHSASASSEIYVRYQSKVDWQNHVTPPDWVIVP